MATLTIQLQWVRGDSSKAEASFFKINEQATPINDTEKRLLKSRKKSNAIAARAIIRSGTGHKYWAKFDPTFQAEIEGLAKEINEMLFNPKLETPIKTLDLPLAGRGYSSQTLTLILDLINISNNIKSDEDVAEDAIGEKTISILKNTKKVLSRITGLHASSLGLHPVVYFYSAAGRYQITAFLAIVEMVKEFEAKNNFTKFTNARAKFEEFMLKYKNIVNQLNFKYGSGLKSYKKLEALLIVIINLINENKTEEEILKYLSDSPEYSFLKPEEVEFYKTGRTDFSTEAKSTAFLRDALTNPLKCKICNGLIHKNSISIDHKERKQDGGSGNADNAQLTHPYCNSTIKN